MLENDTDATLQSLKKGRTRGQSQEATANQMRRCANIATGEKGDRWFERGSIVRWPPEHFCHGELHSDAIQFTHKRIELSALGWE